MLVHGSSLHARAAGDSPRTDIGFATRYLLRPAGAVAYALPLLAAILTDAVSRSPAANAPAVFAMLELFTLSLATAALILHIAVRRLRQAIGSRRAIAAVAWTLLVAEGWGLSSWLMRGVHG